MKNLKTPPHDWQPLGKAEIGGALYWCWQCGTARVEFERRAFLYTVPGTRPAAGTRIEPDCTPLAMGAAVVQGIEAFVKILEARGRGVVQHFNAHDFGQVVNQIVLDFCKTHPEFGDVAGAKSDGSGS